MIRGERHLEVRRVSPLALARLGSWSLAAAGVEAFRHEYSLRGAGPALTPSGAPKGVAPLSPGDARPHPFGCAEGRGALSPGDTRRGVEGEGAQTQSGEARSSRRCRWLLRRHPRRQRLEFCAHFAPLDLRQPQPLPDAVWFDAGPPFTQGEGPAAHVEG